MVLSNCVDNLHTIYIGVVKKLVELIFFTKKMLGNNAKIAEIDNEIIKNFGCFEIEKLNSIYMVSDWKAKDYRNFLLHYSLPLLYEYGCEQTQKIFGELSEAIYILSERFLDDDMVRKAEVRINRMLILVVKVFGETTITANFHDLSHTCKIIKNSGPFWLHSTFNYENLNGIIRKFVINLLN